MQPQAIGKNYVEQVENMLRNEIEGHCIPGVGFIVTLIQILQRKKGMVQPGTGHVKVPVQYRALVFKPLTGEVMDTIITECLPLGIMCTCGPLKCFVTLKVGGIKNIN